jgi:hypothetical protein
MVFINFYSIDQTVPDSAVNNLLHNPIKLTELRTWITSKTFPEEQIRNEYDVSSYSILIFTIISLLLEITYRISSSKNYCNST